MEEKNEVVQKREEEAAQKLKAAAEAGDIDGLYSSIQQDPDILEHIDKIRFVQTPLHVAASVGHTRFAMEIMRLKPSFGSKLNPDGLSPLHLALQNGHSHTIERLIMSDKEVIRVKGREGLTPLHYAVEKNDIHHLVEFLCACPASIEDLTVRDETAVHIAVKYLNLEAFKVLLGWILRAKNTWLLNQRDEEGKTIIDIANDLDHSVAKEEIVNALRNAEARSILQPKNTRLLNQRDENGNNIADPSAFKEEIVNASRNTVGALESCAGDKNNYICLANFLKSPVDYLDSMIYIFCLLMRKKLSMEERNAILVVAVLIATSSYQAVLTPPVDNQLQVFNSAHISATMVSTNNLLPTNESHRNATTFRTPSPTSTNPFHRVLFNNSYGVYTFGDFFYQYYMFNTAAFSISIVVIIAVLLLPLRMVNFLLYVSLICLFMSFGLLFSVLRGSLWFMKPHSLLIPFITFLGLLPDFACMVFLRWSLVSTRLRLYQKLFML